MLRKKKTNGVLSGRSRSWRPYLEQLEDRRLLAGELPTIDAIADITLEEDAPMQTIHLTGITAGSGETQPLRVTATSSNTTLIPNLKVSYTSADSIGSLRFTPLADQHGTTTITVTVEDGGLDDDLSTTGDNATTTATFDVKVIPVNDRPMLDLIIENQPVNSWNQLGSDIDGESAEDYSGYVSLSADGRTVAIGAPHNDGNGFDSGHVRIYRWADGSWNQLGTDIDGETKEDRSGHSVSLSADGRTVAIGAVHNNGNGHHSGQVRIYRWLDGSWYQLGSDIDGEAAGDYTGDSVSLSADGNVLAIGAPRNDDDANGEFTGHVRIYRWLDGSWNQLGSDIFGEAAGDYSGYVSICADGSTVAIGARNNDGNGDNSGHVRIYRWLDGNWNQLGTDIDGEAAVDWSGWGTSLSADGSTVAIGAQSNNGNGNNSGHVRIYRWADGSWNQLGTDIDGEAAYDRFGSIVSISADGSTVAIGAYDNDGNGADSGHVRIYRWVDNNWNQVGSDIDGEAAGDYSGHSVSLSADGSTVAIGARNSDGNGADSGHVRIYRLADITLADGETEQTVQLAGISAGGGETQPLRVTATSSNTDLIADPTVAYTSAESTGSLKFTPVANQHGTSTITVTVEDGGLDNNLETGEDNVSVSTTFDVTVNRGNYWHNNSLPEDVNADGYVTPFDALLIIRQLNESGSAKLPRNRPSDTPMFDVNDDQWISPHDAIHVINMLNNAGGEGEFGLSHVLMVGVNLKSASFATSAAGQSPDDDLLGNRETDPIGHPEIGFTRLIRVIDVVEAEQDELEGINENLIEHITTSEEDALVLLDLFFGQL